jgi:hypothetical protein
VRRLAMMMERKIFDAEVKASDAKALIVEHFISTESKDRVGDIVRASGMKVRGKPVVLLSHGHDGTMGSEPIAKPLSLKKGEFKGVKGVVARTQFFPDEIGKRLFEKTVGGYMPNWSIGFISLESTPRPEKQSDSPMMRGGRDITKWELLEYSLVGVPAQPDAQTISEMDPSKNVEYVAVKFLSSDRKNEKEELLDGEGKIVEDAKEVEMEVEAESAGNESDPPDTGEQKAAQEGAEGGEEEIVFEKGDPPPPPPPLGDESRLQSIEESIRALKQTLDDLAKRLDPPAPVEEPAPTVIADPEKDAAGDNPPEPKRPRLVFVRTAKESSAERVKRITEAIVAETRKVARAAMTEELNRLKGKVP